MPAESEKPIIAVVSLYKCDMFNEQCNKYLNEGYFLASISSTPLSKEEAKKHFEVHFFAVFIKDKKVLAFNQ